MKHLVIAYVVCFSCGTIFLCVSSQNSCPTGWFGSNCKYKCRCTDNGCDIDGNCRSSFRCLAGWFGPACQYVDVAYGGSERAEITDGDESTCATMSSKHTEIFKFSQEWVITWLRIHVNTTGIQQRLFIVLRQNSSNHECYSLTRYFLDHRTLEIHCNVTRLSNRVVLIGDAIHELCSVYVSGGRNVAVKENATQPTTFSEISARTGNVNITFKASLAVDGTVVSDLYDPPYCASTHYQMNPSWHLSLSQARRVHKYIIYNTGNSSRLIGFELQSFDPQQRSVFQYISNISIPRPVYYVDQPHVLVQTIKLKPSPAETILTLCEVEVYGDSVCETGKYGLECERTCNCRNPNDHCLVTGVCPSGCANGYMGPQCTSECAKETYGQDCQHSCSQSCVPSTDSNNSSCDPVNGDCLNGCRVGYTGHDCTAKCANNTYGQGCRQSCSQNCIPRSAANTSSCDHVDGICLHGCPPGVTGQMCVTRCPADMYGHDCQQRCSPACVPSTEANRSSCHQTDGSCHNGCLSGYTGSMCLQRCAKGTYGRGCLLSCSNECIPPSDATKSSCDHTDGTCLSGCRPGVTGDMCVAKCPKNMYGQGCQEQCSQMCEPSTDAHRSSCSHSDGSCVNDCPPGYTGFRCDENCSSEKYGQNCQKTCSKRCIQSVSASLCDYIQGVCLHGCQTGFKGPYCDEQCANETYGPDCKHQCSKNCAPSSKAKNSSCHHISGMCVHGCKSEFIGSQCTEMMMSNSMTPYIVAMCLLFAFFCFLVFCLLRKKPAEAKSEMANLPNLPSAEETQGPEPDNSDDISSVGESSSGDFSDYDIPSSYV